MSIAPPRETAQADTHAARAHRIGSNLRLDLAACYGVEPAGGGTRLPTPPSLLERPAIVNTTLRTNNARTSARAILTPRTTFTCTYKLGPA